MRTLFELILSLVLTLPMAAEAARGNQADTSRNAAVPRKVETGKAQPASRVASKPPARTPARPEASRAARAPKAGESRRVAAVRPGDVRSQRQGLAVRGAAAATLSRGAVPEARSCSRRNGRTVCTTTGARTTAPREGAVSWQRGLPTASNAQRACPAGTFATLARGHDDVVRCMPI
jgi:hypothetical protein